MSALLIGIMAFYIILMFFFGTTTFADPIRGFEVMNQYIDGGKWNTLSYPSSLNPFIDLGLYALA